MRSVALYGLERIRTGTLSAQMAGGVKAAARTFTLCRGYAVPPKIRIKLDKGVMSANSKPDPRVI